MITEHITSFVVMPEHSNYMNMLFGGKLLAEMDICAAMTVRQFLYESPCDRALTVGVEKVKFLIGAEIGDLIFLKGKITYSGVKSIKIWIEGWRSRKGGNEHICEGEFIFVSAKDVDGKVLVTPHGMKLN